MADIIYNPPDSLAPSPLRAEPVWRLLVPLILTHLLTACGGGGSTVGGGTTQTLTLSGTVSMGDRVRSATVAATLINADGTDGDVVGSGTTDAGGLFSLTVTAPTGAPLRLAVSSGLVSDVPTGQTITVQPGALVLDLPPPSGNRPGLQITPLTTFAHKVGKKNMAGGLTPAAAIAQAHKDIGVQFGITTLDANGNILDGDITTTLPRTDGVVTAAEQRHELALLALAQQAKDLNVHPALLVSSMARDAEDGVFDGKVNNITINITITVALPADAASTRFVSALTSFIQSALNTTGLTTTSTVVAGVTNNTVATVTINPTSALISVGQTQQFSATALNTTGGTISGPLITWASSNPAIATVSSSGLATGIGAGTTTIAAAVGGVTGTATLTVAPISATPSAPTGVSATAGNGQATISWSAISGATSYTLYMASQSGVTKSTYAGLPNGMKHPSVTSPYAHTGLTNGTTYYFVVTAVNADGESAESTQVSATPTTTVVSAGLLSVVNFDTDPKGVAFTNRQLLSIEYASWGVTFSLPTASPKIINQATDPADAIPVSTPFLLGGNINTGLSATEPLTITFQRLASRVSLYVVDNESLGGSATFRDLNGNPLDSVSFQVLSSGAAQLISSSAPGVKSILLSHTSTGDGWFIDDLRYELIQP